MNVWKIAHHLITILQTTKREHVPQPVPLALSHRLEAVHVCKIVQQGPMLIPWLHLEDCVPQHAYLLTLHQI